MNRGREMDKDRMIKLRDDLAELRTECLGRSFDADGAVLLSHTIRWLWFRIEGKPYVPPQD
jgi:hypothetical protein